MTHPDIQYMIVMERRRDELAEAAHYRLLKEAQAAKGRLSSPKPLNHQRAGVVARLGEALLLVLARILSYAGERMLGLSCRLQTRYLLLAEDTSEVQPSPCTS